MELTRSRVPACIVLSVCHAPLFSNNSARPYIWEYSVVICIYAFAAKRPPDTLGFHFATIP